MATASTSRNYDQWKMPIYRWPSPAAFRESPLLEDGIHTTDLPSGYALDLLLRGNPLSSDGHSHVLVFLAGAVTGRADKQGPFFSGLGIAGKLDMPVVAVADPGLETDPSINLAWYTGRIDGGFQDDLADVLRSIASRAGKPLLLVGGSGAGYAALQLAEVLSESATALVWNPQTSILDYHPGPVRTYVRRVHGFAAGLVSTETWKSDVAARIGDRAQIALRGADSVTSARGVLYLQNRTDWHRENHLDPWLKASSWQRRGSSSGGEIFAHGDEHAVVVADFADGHGAPNGDLIAFLIAEIQSGRTSLLSIAEEIGSEYAP
ncbi:hypothetical protein [Zhihengliuella halotolerans]|uniref:hypothetical protein n=1 Tax=Zhihengliuella halotolerans TaxID=370736 RepID=UPI000C7FA197|nr:hypothetical protein [Zhihengliuella halotolerans]